MKKIEKALSKSYPPTVIYLDGLIELTTIIEASAGIREIVADDYIFDSLTDLKANTQLLHPKNLTIGFSEPYGSIELLTRDTRLYVSTNSNEGTGLFSKLDSVLLKHVRRPKFLFTWWGYIIIPFLALFVGIGSELLLGKNGERTGQILAGIIYVYWVAKYQLLPLNQHSKIIVSLLKDRPNFFQRKGDDLLVAFMSVVVGFLLGYFFQKEPSDSKFSSLLISNLPSAPREFSLDPKLQRQ